MPQGGLWYTLWPNWKAEKKNSENRSADPLDWKTQHARSRSHIDAPPKHSLKVTSSCAPTTRCSCAMIFHEATDCQHTDCQHTNHYPKTSKAVLLSSTPQGSQLNNLGNPTESRNSSEPMAATFQIHYLSVQSTKPNGITCK